MAVIADVYQICAIVEAPGTSIAYHAGSLTFGHRCLYVIIILWAFLSNSLYSAFVSQVQCATDMGIVLRHELCNGDESYT